METNLELRAIGFINMGVACFQALLDQSILSFPEYESKVCASGVLILFCVLIQQCINVDNILTTPSPLRVASDTSLPYFRN